MSDQKKRGRPLQLVTYKSQSDRYDLCMYCRKTLKQHNNDKSCYHQKVNIYCLIDPFDSSIRYVGRTAGDLTTRLNAHIAEGRKTKVSVNSRKFEWLRSLNERGAKPEIKMLEVVSISDIEAEKRWVRRCERDGLNLVNEQFSLHNNHVKLQLMWVHELLKAFDNKDSRVIESMLDELRGLL